MRPIAMRLRFSFTTLLACVVAQAAEPPDEPHTEPPTGESVVETIEATELRAAPDAESKVLRTVPADTLLVWVEKKEANGFHRVIGKTAGPQGWVRSEAVKESDEPVAEFHEKTKKCATSLDDCPLRGCAPGGTPEALGNERKRTVPEDPPERTLSRADFAELQRQADDAVGSGPREVSRAGRDALSGLTVSGGKVGEGTAVRAHGWLATGGRGLHVNAAGESVNCDLKGAKSNDFHIPLAFERDRPEFDAIVVEMIPQHRSEKWTIEALQEVQAAGREVWVEGALYYDNLHYVNADSEHKLDHHPKRFSLWEIHPITKFLVCRKDSCDRANEKEWEAL